ncbi:hypothetical protein PENSPDRAFT_679965 [Peniophora sp. CONT]|nr:hypothetical protein PENSPDRAFT_679965 [Peniophora sp. CONT]
MFKLSNTLFATAVALFVMIGGASAATSGRRDIALADNPVDACNGSNNYGVGHSCAWSGGNEGTCQINASGVLVCVN